MAANEDENKQGKAAKKATGGSRKDQPTDEGAAAAGKARKPAKVPGRKRRSAPADTVQLPSGRHGLNPTFVTQHQRERLMTAIAKTVAELGYRSATIEEMIKRAGVSRRTFYDIFESKDDAYLETYTGISDQLYERVAAAFLGAKNGPDRLRDCLTAFLDFMASDPNAAYMAIVDVLSAGPEALERRDQLVRNFVSLLDQSGLPMEEPVPSLASEAVVGGIYEVVYKRILNGETEQLRELLPEIYYYSLVPFVGREEGRDLYLQLLEHLGQK